MTWTILKHATGMEVIVVEPMWIPSTVLIANVWIQTFVKMMTRAIVKKTLRPITPFAKRIQITPTNARRPVANVKVHARISCLFIGANTTRRKIFASWLGPRKNAKKLVKYHAMNEHFYFAGQFEDYFELLWFKWNKCKVVRQISIKWVI